MNQDEAFDQELARLYKAALLDEDFQHQVASDLRTLPEAAQAELHEPEQAFVRDETLSAAVKERLREIIPPCRQQPARQIPWWRRLLADNWSSALLPGPLISIPAALMTGILFGVLLPMLLAPQNHPQEAEMRGASTHTSDTFEQARQDPQQWLEAIAVLLHQGKVEQAREELQAFALQYPNYQPK